MDKPAPYDEAVQGFHSPTGLPTPVAVPYTSLEELALDIRFDRYRHLLCQVHSQGSASRSSTILEGLSHLTRIGNRYGV